jgi:hypothetical protein
MPDKLQIKPPACKLFNYFRRRSEEVAAAGEGIKAEFNTSFCNLPLLTANPFSVLLQPVITYLRMISTSLDNRPSAEAFFRL